jgi:hypothetical protein
MSHMAKMIMRFVLATSIAFVGLFWNGDIPSNLQSTIISSAHAVIGRPLTPLSYAGVARRSTARAVVGGAAVYGAPVVVVAPVVVAPVCAQVVNVYGQITTVCR